MAKPYPEYSVILLRPEGENVDPSGLDRMIRAAADQDHPPAKIVVAGGPECPGDSAGSIPLVSVPGNGTARPELLNRAWARTETPFVLLLQSHDAPVYLNRSAARCFLTAAERNPNAGLVYADYALCGAEDREVHLLKHHPGRVRDNQDMGRAWLIRRDAAPSPPFDPELRFHEFYDLRLKISQSYDLAHVANRYAGSLYRVEASARGHDVFDYLLASRESQVEAEQVLTRHLQAVGAWLAPGAGYRERPPLPKEGLRASVVIPVNNRPDFIGAAIESVLAQTVPEIEVIVVVNGGADDPTIDAVRRYMPGGGLHRPDRPAVRLIVLDINNIGLCLNAGIREAEGAVYVQLDSDDRLKPDAVEKVLAMLDSDPTIGMVIGSYEVWEQAPDGRLFRREEIPVVTHDEWTEENGRNNLLRVNGAGAPRCIPVAVVEEMGWFGINDEPFARNYGEDYDMVLRISERYRVGRIWDPIYEVVRHPGGTDHSIDQATVDRNDEAKDWMRLQAIFRRRAMNSEARGTGS